MSQKCHSMSSIYIGTWRSKTAQKESSEAKDSFHVLEIPPDADRIKFVGQSTGCGFFFTEKGCLYSWSTRARYGSPTSDVFRPQAMKFEFPGFVCKQFCSGDFCCALDITGYVVAWGKHFGKAPTKVDLPGPCRHIATNSSLLVATLADGSVMVTDNKRTKRHSRLPDDDLAVEAVAVSHDKNTIFAAVTEKGSLYCWCKRRDSSPVWGMLHDLPQRVPVVLEDKEVLVQHVFGYSNLWVVTDGNIVGCCGENAGTALGLPGPVPCNGIRTSDFPFNGKLLSDIVMGDDYTIVLTESGSCYAAGRLDGILPLPNGDGKNITYDHFIRCDFFGGQRVTHISCSTLSAMFLTNGAHRSKSIADSFRSCPLPREPQVAVVDGEMDVMIASGVEEFAKYGLKERDVLSMGAGSLGMLVGVLFSDHSMAVLSTDFQIGLVSVDISQCNSEYPLVERPGRRLIQYEGMNRGIDPEGEFYGFQHGDTLQDGSIILGESGNLVFYRDAQTNEIRQLNDITKVFRNGHQLVVANIDGKFVCTETVTQHKILHASLGCGVIVSQSSQDLVVCFPGYSKGHLISHASKQLILQEAVTRSMQVFVSPTESITISSETDMLLELVHTPNGYGTVAGVVPNDSQLAVWCEKDYSSGIVTLFPCTSVSLVARLNQPLLIDNTYDANCATFASLSTPLLPGDEITGGLTVIGTKDGAIYARSTDGTISQIDPTTPVLVRHLFAMHPCSTFLLKQTLLYSYSPSRSLRR